MSRYMVALILALMCFTAIGVSTQKPASTARPIWTASLKRYGYRGPHRGLVNDPGSLVNIAFSKSTVAVIFDEKAEEHQGTATDRKVWSGWRLSIVFLNPATGAVVGKRSWIGDLDWHRRLIPTAGGDFIFLLTKPPEPLEVPLTKGSRPQWQESHSATLFLLSSSGDELKRVVLSTGGEGWQMLASPSGRFVLLSDKRSNSIEFRLLDTQTLEQRAAWRTGYAAKMRPSAISDDYVLFSAANDSLIGGFSTESRKISIPRGHVQFLSADSILTVTPPTLNPSGVATITSVTGEEVTSIDLGIHDPMEGALPPFVAADAQRFGTIIDRITGRGFLQKYQRIVYVWERPDNDVVLKTVIPYSESPAAAISADGSALTVLNAGKIALYNLRSRRVSSQ